MMRSQFLIISACVVLGGCRSNAVVFATGTTFGVDLNAIDSGKQTVRIGYQRKEGVVMPMRDENDKLRKKAFSVASIYDLESGSLLLAGLGEMTIDQVFATGKAAKKPRAVAMGFMALKGRDLSELMKEEEVEAGAELIRLLKKHRGGPEEPVVVQAIADAFEDAAIDTYGKAKFAVGDLPAGSEAKLVKALDAVQAALRAK